MQRGDRLALLVAHHYRDHDQVDFGLEDEGQVQRSGIGREGSLRAGGESNRT